MFKLYTVNYELQLIYYSTIKYASINIKINLLVAS